MLHQVRALCTSWIVHMYQSVPHTGVLSRQHHCNDDSQVRSAPLHSSSAPTCLAAHIHVSQHMFLYDNHLPCLIFGFVYCCILHVLHICSLKHGSILVTLLACGLQLHSFASTVTLPFYAGPVCAICHLYAMSTSSARYQCVASNISIHIQQKNKHNCAAANAGIMAHFVCISPSFCYTDAVPHLFCQVQRG